jgi:hypothetical protein
MGKGYAEGPAAEERYESLERGDSDAPSTGPRERPAVYGATEDDPKQHFLGWLDDLDPDELFRSGDAWGLSVRRRRES